MRKIKALKSIAVSLFVIILLWFILDNFLVILALLFEKDVLHLGHFDGDSPSAFLKAVILIKTIASGLFIYGSSFLIRVMLLKNVMDYFNNKVSLFLFKAGKFLIISNVITFFLNFTAFFINTKYLIYYGGDSKYLSLLMVVFGLFLMIFSKVLKQGNQIKQENDLTI
ncbi:DUF2975 domain-containing protein [Tenacibaculum soleae]|uniref:DUF2975 domain-containing protein n=1 Tax=Tenacibaculum soleae TaxID=447689 RepID=UPI002300F175|nr:DUF2975 domain-containing protein [Tenacibaculum soleae]